MKKVMLLASENMCDILKTALDGKYRTLPCSDPADCRALSLQEAPDALILELSLQGADGMTFLNDSSDCMPNTIFVLTSFISDKLLYDLEQADASAVLRIPFRLAYLEEQLTNYVKKTPSRESGRSK